MCSSSPPKTNTQPEQQKLRVLLDRDRYDKLKGSGNSGTLLYPRNGGGAGLGGRSGGDAFLPVVGDTPPALAGLNTTP